MPSAMPLLTHSTSLSARDRKRRHHVGHQRIDGRTWILLRIRGDSSFGSGRPGQRFLLRIDHVNGERALLVVDGLDRGGIEGTVIATAVAVITSSSNVSRARRGHNVLLILDIRVEVEEQV